MEISKFLESRDKAVSSKEKNAETIVRKIFAAFKERTLHLRSPYEAVSRKEVASAAEEDGERERKLAELNPVISYYVKKARLMQEAFGFLDEAAKDSARREKVKKIWGTLEKSGLQSLQDLKPGILNQTVAIHLLRRQGFNIYFPKPIEDVLGAVDLYAVHRDKPDTVFLFQVKPNREGTRPIVSDLSRGALNPQFSDPSFKVVREYADKLSERYKDLQFRAMAFLAPKIALEPEIDPLIGKPSPKYLDKYVNLVLP